MSAARLAAAALLALAGEVAAHAELVASSPADGARLASAPARIELSFNEPVTPLGAKLLDGAGRALPLPAPISRGEGVTVALEPLAEGRYTFTYRVASLDSHPVSGSIAFAVGAATVQPAGARAEADAGRPWRVALRALRDLALLVAAGGALFALGVAAFPHERAVLTAAALLAALLSILGIGLQGSVLLGEGASPFAHAAWHAGLASSFGRSALLAAAAALLLAVSAGLARGAWRGVGLALGALAAIASLALTGHAAARGGPAPGTLVVHALAAAFWAGSLVALLLIVRNTARGAALGALQRFSRLGMPAVAALLVAGATLALLQLPSLAELTASRYGQLILAKLALFGALLALASLNRFRYLPWLAAGDARAVPRLRRSIAAEVALMVGVGALTALLVQTPPPRPAGFSATLQAEGRSVELSVEPARAGTNTITVRFRDAQGRAFDPAEVALAAGNEAAGVAPAARAMRRLRPGEYRREGDELAFPGLWTLEVQARFGEFDQKSYRLQAPVR